MLLKYPFSVYKVIVSFNPLLNWLGAEALH